MRIKKVNIGTEEKPIIVSIGDYWDSERMENITELLCEYNDLFQATFSDMKGVARELVEMKIPLRPDAIPIRHIPYRLNPIYKHTVNTELDRMLESRIIEPVEESEWISPMVVQGK
jgi:hypothetical protein